MAKKFEISGDAAQMADQLASGRLDPRTARRTIAKLNRLGIPGPAIIDRLGGGRALKGLGVTWSPEQRAFGLLEAPKTSATLPPSLTAIAKDLVGSLTELAATPTLRTSASGTLSFPEHGNLASVNHVKAVLRRTKGDAAATAGMLRTQPAISRVALITNNFAGNYGGLNAVSSTKIDNLVGVITRPKSQASATWDAMRHEEPLDAMSWFGIEHDNTVLPLVRTRRSLTTLRSQPVQLRASSDNGPLREASVARTINLVDERWYLLDVEAATALDAETTAGVNGRIGVYPSLDALELLQASIAERDGQALAPMIGMLVAEQTLDTLPSTVRVGASEADDNRLSEQYA